MTEMYRLIIATRKRPEYYREVVIYKITVLINDLIDYISLDVYR